MKENNLLEMLLTLFEKTLTQLKEAYVPEMPDEAKAGQSTDLQVTSTEGKKKTFEMMWFRSADKDSMRVFTLEEEHKLTKASHQFLKRLERLGVLSSDVMELIINRLLFSESR